MSDVVEIDKQGDIAVLRFNREAALNALTMELARGIVDLASAYYPLYAAASGGHREVVAALIAAGANVDKAMNDGFTPLLAAAENGHHEVVTALLAANATVDLAMNDGRTPLSAAALESVNALVCRHTYPPSRLCKASGAASVSSPPCALPAYDAKKAGVRKKNLSVAQLFVQSAHAPARRGNW